MTPLEQQIQELKTQYPEAVITPQASGAHLVELRKYLLPSGWNKRSVTVIFLAPPGYPAAQPDCFWVEPDERGPVRLANGATPQGTNDSNPIPGIGPRGTWFSWHLQTWDPNRDTLLRYVSVIKTRLNSLQ